MIVEVTNLTDGPGRAPKEVKLFGRSLNPGDSIKVYAALVDQKTRSIEAAGDISIGQIPPWYAAFKARKSKVLTQAELEERLVTKRPQPVVADPVEEVLMKSEDPKKKR